MSSFEYRLQRIPQGVVVLDAERRVVSTDMFAARLFRAAGWDAAPGTPILDLHPGPARAKVAWLLDAAAAEPDQPASTAMTLPMGTVVARISALIGGGWCMVFHLIDGPPPQAPAETMLKLPLDARRGVRLLDVSAAAGLQADGRYSKVFVKDGGVMDCTLGFAELLKRLDPSLFMAVHRSWLVNLQAVRAVERLDGRWVMRLDAPDAPPVPVSRAKIDEVRRRLAL